MSALFCAGSLFLDDAQHDYLYALMVDDQAAPGVRGKEIVESKQNVLRLTLPERDGDEETVIRQSKISQIKDLFPDFGDGFVDACLEVYDNDPEKVIERILEGTLHPDLASLDTSIATKPVASQKVKPVKDKGKGKINETSFPDSDSVWVDKPISLVGVSSTLSLAGSSSSGSASAGGTPPLSNISNPVAKTGVNAGRYVRRQKGDDENFSSLLAGNEDIRLATKAAAVRAEYEDEYDDSFDELGQYVADTGGVEETESLADLVGNRGRARSENSHPRNSGRPSPVTPWGGAASSPRDRKPSGGNTSALGEGQRGDRQHPVATSKGGFEPPRGDQQYTSSAQRSPPRGDRQYSANTPRSNAEAHRGERRYSTGAPSTNLGAQKGERNFATGASASNEGQRGDRPFRAVNTFDAQKGDRQYSGGSSSNDTTGYQFGVPKPDGDGQLNETESNSAAGRGRGGRGNRGRGKNRGPQPKSDFYLKDGKLYSYKVAGAIGVGSVEEAEQIKREEAVTIYGLGEGGNVPRPLGGGENDGNQDGSDSNYRKGPQSPMGDGGRGRGGRGRGGPAGRGRGRGENDNHHRKDKAMKKHFAGLSGL